MSFEYFIGGRYLRARQKQAFINLITILSIAGVTVGVMALIVVLAVMAGFEADLKSHILGGQSHVIVLRHGGDFSDYPQVMQAVEKVDGVIAATPFIFTQGMLRSKNGLSGAVIRGIDPATAGQVITTLKKLNLPSGSDINNQPGNQVAVPGIVLGKVLARNLGVVEGKSVHLTIRYDDLFYKEITPPQESTDFSLHQVLFYFLIV